MAKTWTDDDPKAALMTKKRALIVDAALKAFLAAGYAESSVNQIAASASVSIKTLYRHYESKAELFSAVMQAACGRGPGAEIDARDAPPPAWYALPPAEALPLAGEDYLSHALSPDHLALYRVVARDAHRFPELGQRYLEATTGARDALFAGYLDLWAGREGWIVRDPKGAAQIFAGLLKARIFDPVLLGLSSAQATELAAQAREASRHMLVLLRANHF